MAARSVTQQAKVGIAFNVASMGLGTLILLVGTVILTRLLEPRDFGLVQMCLLVVEFATRMGDFGIGTAIVQQKEDVRPEQLNALFLADFGIRVVMFTATVLGTPLVVRYFHEPRLASVLPAVALYVVVDCLSTPSIALLERQLKFKASATIEVTSRAIDMFTSVGLALAGAGLYSLIAGRVFGSLSAAVIGMAMSGWRPSLRADFRGSKRLFKFGGWVMVRSFFQYLADNIDYFFVGRFLGTAELGFYSRAFTIMRLPVRRVTRAVNNVMFSAFARVQNDPARIREGLRKTILAISLVTYPMMIGMGFMASEFVNLAFGPQWSPMTVPLQVMCLAGAIRSTEPLLVSVITSTGHVRLAAFRRFAEFALLAVGCYVGVKFGISGVAVAVAATSVVMVLLLTSLCNYVGIDAWRPFFGAQVPALLGGAAMAGGLYAAKRVVAGTASSHGGLSFTVICGLGALAYVVCLLVLRPAAVVALWREVGGDARGAWAALRARLAGRSRSGS